jgi:hypothetical protein
VNRIVDLARYRALEQQAATLEAGLRVAPPGDGRDELAAEALATRALMLGLERAA